MVAMRTARRRIRILPIRTKVWLHTPFVTWPEASSIRRTPETGNRLMIPSPN